VLAALLKMQQKILLEEWLIAGFMSIWICVAAVSALIGLFFFVIWIIALVDCARRKLDEFPAGGENSKTIWLVILIVTFFVGNLNGIAAIVYYFMVMKKMPQKKLKKMPRKK